MEQAKRPMPLVADLYGDLLQNEPAAPTRLIDYWPGLLVTAIAALAAAYIAEHYKAPLMLMGLLFGLAFNFASADARMQAGLNFASKTLLRWGIILMGAQITLGQIVSLGLWPFLAVVLIIVVVIGASVATAKSLRLGTNYGILAGGAVAICGASAALALSALLGEKRISQAQLTLTLVCIAAASATAMSIYPGLAFELGFDDHQAGFLMGSSIHDVAQALGAGFSVSHDAGVIATIVKLTRVSLLVPTLATISLFLVKDKDSVKGGNAFPWFVLGFLIVASFNSILPVPPAITSALAGTASAMLLLAVVATGIRSPMQLLLQQGWRASMPVLVGTLVSLGTGLILARLVF